MTTTMMMDDEDKDENFDGDGFVADLGQLFNNTEIELLPLEDSYQVYTDLGVDSPELTQSILGIKDLIRDNVRSHLLYLNYFAFIAR
jgi:hypothetical protein